MEKFCHMQSGSRCLCGTRYESFWSPSVMNAVFMCVLLAEGTLGKGDLAVRIRMILYRKFD